jgi:tetratricopeptide (TPR) repeat protein
VPVPPPRRRPGHPTPRRAKTSTADDFEKNRYFGDFYFHRKEYDRAAEYYDKCLALDGSNVPLLLRIGELNALNKDVEKARSYWEKVLRIDPKNSEADNNLRRLLRGDY